MSNIIPYVKASENRNHVNVIRYVQGMKPSYRRKRMREQLRNLLIVNDCYTRPFNATGKTAFSRLFVKGS